MVLILFGFKFCKTLPESRLKRKLKEGFTLKQNTKELLLPVTVYFTSNEFIYFIRDDLYNFIKQSHLINVLFLHKN